MIAKHISSAIRALSPALATLTEGLILIGGVVSVAYGAWEAWKPAGPMVGGALVIAGVILRARGS